MFANRGGFCTASFIGPCVGVIMQCSDVFAQPDAALFPASGPPLGLRGDRVAQAAVSPAERAAPTGSGDASLRPPKAAEPESEAAQGGGLGWRIPPIRWGATTTTEARMYQVGDQKARFQQVEHATIRAASYIWQPWFAHVGGSLGLLSAHERGGGSAGDTSPKASSTAITANATLALFPVSRFPFNGYFERSDSRASGEMTQNDSTNTRFGLRQSYTPAEGQSSYSATFDRSTLESPLFGRDTVNALAVNATRSFGSQTVDLSGGHTGNTRSNTGESTRLTRLYGRHRYQPHSTLSVESLATATGSEFHLVSAGVPRDNRARFLQGSSFATWRPDEDSPLYVTGGVRAFHAGIENEGATNDTLTLSGNVAASYALTRNTTLGGSAIVTHAAAGDVKDLVTAQNVSITHVADPFDLRGFLYTWNAAVNAGNQTSTSTGGKRNVGGQLGHSVTRSYAVNDISLVTMNLGQSLSSTFDTVTDLSKTLGHNAGLTWRLTPRATTTAFASLLAADSRTSGHNQNRFQLLNAQASGQIQFSRYAFAAANLTVQAVRQTAPLTPPAGFNWSTSGNFSYQHTRAFDVPRLRYFASYSVNQSQLTSRLQGDVDAKREQVGQSLEQRLDWNVGRIEMRVSMRVASVDGKRNALVYFRLGRQFGGF